MNFWYGGGERQEAYFWYFCCLQYFNCRWWVVAWTKKSFLGPAVTAFFVFQVLFKDEWRRVSRRFHLFVSDINQGKKEARWVVGSRLCWLLRLNSVVHSRGEHLTIQLLCLICMLSRGVRPRVPGVIEGSKDAALVWNQGDKLLGRVAFWIVSSIHDGAPPWNELVACTDWLYLQERPNRRCLSRFLMRPRLEVLQILGVGGLEVHGICIRRLVYRGVNEGRWDYMKSYLCWCRNVACADSTGSNRIEKDRVGVPPGLVWGKVEKRWRDLVCGGVFRWLRCNSGFVYVFFTQGMVLVLLGVGVILGNGYGI